MHALGQNKENAQNNYQAEKSGKKPQNYLGKYIRLRKGKIDVKDQSVLSDKVANCDFSSKIEPTTCEKKFEDFEKQNVPKYCR
jgi:hypothetical protein